MLLPIVIAVTLNQSDWVCTNGNQYQAYSLSWSEHPARFMSVLSLQHCVLLHSFFFFTFIKGSKPAVVFLRFSFWGDWCFCTGGWIYGRRSCSSVMEFWHNLWEVSFEGVSYMVGAKQSPAKLTTAPTPTGMQSDIAGYNMLTCSGKLLASGFRVEWLYVEKPLVLPVCWKKALFFQNSPTRLNTKIPFNSRAPCHA